MKITTVFLIASASVWAATTPPQLASWDVAGINASATNPFAATTLASGVASAILKLGGGITSPSSTADTFGGSGFNQTSLDAAIADGDYLSFTITPGAGNILNISSVTFTTGVAAAITNANFNGALLSSATGFTSASPLATYGFSTASAPKQSVSLSAWSEFQTIVGELEFRLYGFRDTGGTSTFRIRDLTSDDLIIGGSVSTVPEPAFHALLGGLAALGLVVWRRKMRLCR